MLGNLQEKYFLTPVLIDSADGILSSLESTERVILQSTLSKCIARLVLAALLALTQVIDWCILACGACVGLVYTFYKEDSFADFQTCASGCFLMIFGTPVVQLFAIRSACQPLMDFLAVTLVSPQKPEAYDRPSFENCHSLNYWKQSIARESFLPRWLLGRPLDKRSHAQFFQDNCVQDIYTSFSKYPKIQDPIIQPLLCVIQVVCMPVLYLLDLIIAVAYIFITAIRCLVCCASKQDFGHSLYNVACEIDNLFRAIMSVVIYLELFFAWCMGVENYYSQEPNADGYHECIMPQHFDEINTAYKWLGNFWEPSAGI